MKAAHYPRQFERDIKRIKKQSKDIEKLRTVIRYLLEEKQLPPKNRDHRLSGNFATFRECHIEPDWLLIYQSDENTIRFVRTGSHSDLFD